MFNQKFNYQPISRVNLNGKRHYATPDGNKLPSVTTILDKTKPQEQIDALNNWRNRIGHDKAQVITTEAAGVGTVMHKMLEEHCLGQAKEPGTNQVQQIAYPMAQKIITEGLVFLDECWGTEVPLYYEGLYAGSTDLAGVWKGNEAILDFKQTNKPKKEEWIDSYKLQIVAYSLAHNKLHGTNIRTGVILMCSRACEFQHWVVKGADFDYWEGQWWDRVEAYYRINT